MTAKNEHGLTPAKEIFAQKVAAGVPRREAYIAAYPKAAKWSTSTLDPNISRLAAQPHVAARIKALQARGAELAAVESSKILDQLVSIAQSDIGNIIGPDGKVLLPNELDPATRAAVSSFEMDEFGRIKYKFWDKNTAVANAMKHLGLFEKDNAQQPPPAVTRIELVGVKPPKRAE